MSTEKVKAALSAVYTDMLMLKDGSWMPDDDSIGATIDNLELISDELNIEITDTRDG